MRSALFGLAALTLVGCSGGDGEPGNPGASGGHGPEAGGASASASAGSGGAGAPASTGGASGSDGGAIGVSGSGGGAIGSGGGAIGGAGGGSGGNAGSGGMNAGGASGGEAGGGPVLGSKTRMTARPIGMPYAKNGFWEYLPPHYEDGVKRPLLLFMHGSGENGAGTAGTELDKVLRHGPAKLIENNLWTPDRPFIVLSMQHSGATSICPTATEVHDFLSFGIANYHVDTSKVYITGLSCGGHGGDDYLGQYKGEQVAAAVLIAADCTPTYNAAGCSLLDTVGLWVIHGANDGPAADEASMAKFIACPQPRKDARWNLIPNADHQQSWEAVYDDTTFMNNVVAWFLGQSKGP